MYGLYTLEEGGSMGWDKTLISPSLKFSYPDFHVLLKNKHRLKVKSPVAPSIIGGGAEGRWFPHLALECL